MPRKGKDTRTSRHNPNVPDIPGPPAHTLTLRGQHSFVKPLASEPNPSPPPISLDCRGKIGQTVYQLTRGWINHYEHAKELMLQRRRHVMPFDPRTHLQLLCRCRFAAAVAGWHLLTSDEKREYNRRGNARFNRIEGLNVWIRQFVQEHELNEYQLEATLRQAQATIPFQPYPLIGLSPITAEIIEMIDYKSVLFPAAPYAVPAAWIEIPQAVLSWTAQAGKLLVLAQYQIVRSSGSATLVALVASLDGVPVPPTYYTLFSATGQNTTCTLAVTAPITAGAHTLKLFAYVDNAPSVTSSALTGSLICIVFPTTMIKP